MSARRHYNVRCLFQDKGLVGAGGFQIIVFVPAEEMDGHKLLQIDGSGAARIQSVALAPEQPVSQISAQ